MKNKQNRVSTENIKGGKFFVRKNLTLFWNSDLIIIDRINSFVGFYGLPF